MKKLLSLFLFVFLLNMVSSFVVNQDITISISPRLDGSPLSSTPSCNLTVSYNGTLLIPYKAMTWNETTQTVNYTIPRTNITRTGDYNQITTCCVGANCQSQESTFNVNKSGINVEDSTPIFYLGMLLMSVLLSWFFVYLYRNNNESDSYNSFGELIDINWKKHLKPVLFILSTMCILWTIYNAWTISYNFLELDGMSRILFMMWVYPLAIMPYLLGAWILLMIYKLYNDFTSMKEIERFGQ